MPQLCFAYMQLLDLICVQFAKVVNDFFIIEKISAGDIPGIELDSFQEILLSVFDFMGDMVWGVGIYCMFWYGFLGNQQ